MFSVAIVSREFQGLIYSLLDLFHFIVSSPPLDIRFLSKCFSLFFVLMVPIWVSALENIGRGISASGNMSCLLLPPLSQSSTTGDLKQVKNVGRSAGNVAVGFEDVTVCLFQCLSKPLAEEKGTG
ncbi:hypothetical protein RRG08_022712 [Elysia crispata]|uniref:Uncharacterized protein n=1 Tax=Elysia crispata TaxID=231223 RepID=A0AAE0ZDZ2_9GAST|nr:hypothetical protein RRG08_022712 [Elysia crispata]